MPLNEWPGKTWVHDRYGSGTWYDVSAWTYKVPSNISGLAEGQVDQLTLQLYSVNPKNNAPLPVQIVGGQEFLYYKYNPTAPNDYAQWVYQPGGKVIQVTQVPTPAGLGLEVAFEGLERELNAHVPYTDFDPATLRYDKDRLQDLFETRGFTDGNTWDAHSQVSGPFVDYFGTPVQGFYRTNLWAILKSFAMDALAPANYTFRRWYVTSQWSDPTNPGVGTTPAKRVLHYYEALTGPQEPLPFTERRDRVVNLAKDTFEGTGTALLTQTTTGNAWQQLHGIWSRSGGQGYLSTASAGVDAYGAVVDALQADVTVEVAVPVQNTAVRLLARVVSYPAQAYKWEGHFIQNGGADYSVWRWVGGVYTQQGGAIAVTPAAGDIMRWVMSGTSMTAQIERAGVVVGSMTFTSTLNQTATMHGIGKTSVNAGRFDNFRVIGKGIRYYKWRRVLDYTGTTNILAIQGPGSSQFPVTWQNVIRAEAAPGSVRHKQADPWKANQAYSSGDYIRPLADPNGGEYRAVNFGTSGATEPATWATVEGNNTTDNTITWVRDTWTSTASTSVTYTDDGGYLQTTVQEDVMATDNFDRATGPVGKADSGQTWEVTSGPALVIVNQFGFVDVGSAVVDAGIGMSAIVEAKFVVAPTGARLLFRWVDASNHWFVERQAAATKVYKKVAGSDTQLLTTGTIVNNGDTVKVSCRDNAISLYINGVFIVSGTDTKFQGASKHGLGVTSAGAAARFDNFRVWSSYTTKRFGFATFPTALTPNYGIIIKTDGTAKAIESGVELGPSQTATLGVSFRVQLRMEAVVGYPDPKMIVRYLRQAQSGGQWIEFYQHIGFPTINEANPVYGVVNILTPGGALSAVQTRRFTYAVYSDPVSIGKYGRFWAKEMLEDDLLDTNTKRQAAANAIFARFGYPRDTLEAEVKTVHVYGRRVLVNNARLGWVDILRVIAEVRPDQNGRSILILGDSPYEYGADEPLGPILHAPDRDTTSPPEPSNFAASGTGGRDGILSVYQDFSWAVPAGDEFRTQIEIWRVDQPNNVLRNTYAAREGVGRFNYLEPRTAYRARARHLDRAGNPGAFTGTIDFTSAQISLPPPPTWAVTPFPAEGIEAPHGWLRLDWVEPAPPSRPDNGIGSYNIASYNIRYGPYRGYKRILPVNSDLTETVIHQLILGVSYEYEVQAVDENGLESPWSAIQTHTVNPIPYDRGGSRLLVPQGELYNGGESVFGWRWVSQPAGATMEVVQDQVLRGAYSLKITVPAFAGPQTLDIEQDPVDIIKGKYYEAWFGYYPSSGVWSTIQDRYQGYDKTGGSLGTVQIIRQITSGVNGAWDARSTGDQLPSAVNAGITNIRRRFAVTVTAAGGVIYMTSPTWEESIGTTRLHSDIETTVENKYRADGGRVLGTNYGSGVVTLNGLTPDSSNDVIVRGIHSTLTANQSSPRLRTDDPSTYAQLNTNSLRTSNPTTLEDGDWWLINSSGVRTLRIRDGSTTVDLASNNYMAGTSFPGTPGPGAFLRTDRRRQYYWDGSRWVSEAMYVQTHNYLGAPAYTATGEILATGLMSDYALLVERWAFGFFVGSTHNSTNYWKVSLRRLTSGISVDTLATVDLHTPTMFAPDVWQKAPDVTSFSNNPLNTSDIWFQLYIEKVGNPGGIYIQSLVRGREVG